MKKGQFKIKIFSQIIFGDYITNKLDYNPKTKYWEFKCKVPNVSKALKDSYTDVLYTLEAN